MWGWRCHRGHGNLPGVSLPIYGGPDVTVAAVIHGDKPIERIAGLQPCVSATREVRRAQGRDGACGGLPREQGGPTPRVAGAVLRADPRPASQGQQRSIWERHPGAAGTDAPNARCGCAPCLRGKRRSPPTRWKRVRAKFPSHSTAEGLSGWSAWGRTRWQGETVPAMPLPRHGPQPFPSAPQGRSRPRGTIPQGRFPRPRRGAHSRRHLLSPLQRACCVARQRWTWFSGGRKSSRKSSMPISFAW